MSSPLGELEVANLRSQIATLDVELLTAYCLLPSSFVSAAPVDHLQGRDPARCCSFQQRIACGVSPATTSASLCRHRVLKHRRVTTPALRADATDDSCRVRKCPDKCAA